VSGTSADELRRSFDDAFARPPGAPAVAVEELLVVRVAGDPYAVRARETAGVTPGGRIVPVPGPLSELLGITTIRGALVPVYSLRGLLGYPHARDVPPWLLLCGTDQERAALGIDRFERYARLSRSSISVGDDLAGRPHVRELVRTEAEVCAVIDIRSVLDAIRRRIIGVGQQKE